MRAGGRALHFNRPLRSRLPISDHLTQGARTFTRRCRVWTRWIDARRSRLTFLIELLPDCAESHELVGSKNTSNIELMRKPNFRHLGLGHLQFF
jgi:hypothetical protein